MSYAPDDSTSESFNNLASRAQQFGSRAQEKAQDAYEVSRDYVRENPVPVIVGALVVGAALGILLSRDRRQKDASEIARDLLETVYDDISEKLPKLRKQATATKDSLFDQVSDLSQKLRWW